MIKLILALAIFAPSAYGAAGLVDSDGGTKAESSLRFTLDACSGKIAGISCVNKFGRSTDVDNGIMTDVWDGASVATAQPIWMAPTAARIHNIASTSASDDGAPVGVGAQTIRVFGLPDWDTEEVSEDIILNGVTNVPTVNAYVIIHRIKVLTKGASGPNVGTITATAAIDLTITAQINPLEGQTQMAIYGIPSTQTAYMYYHYMSINKANLGTSASAADIGIKFNPDPAAEPTAFLIKHTIGIVNRGTGVHSLKRTLPVKFSGPGILKIQATGGANNLDVSAGFDLLLVDN